MVRGIHLHTNRQQILIRPAYNSHLKGERNYVTVDEPSELSTDQQTLPKAYFYRLNNITGKNLENGQHTAHRTSPHTILIWPASQ